MTTSFPVRETFFQRELRRDYGEPINHEDHREQAKPPNKEKKHSDNDNQEAPTAVRKSVWLVSKEFDLLFVCGIAPWIMGLVAYALTTAGTTTPTSRFSQQTFTFVFAAASLLIGESHQFTSIIRYFKSFLKPQKRTFLNHIPLWMMFILAGEIVTVATVHEAVGLLAWTGVFWMVVLQAAAMFFPPCCFTTSVRKPML